MPQSHGAVVAAAGQQLAAGAERHHEHWVQGTGLEGRADGLVGGRILQPHRAVAAADSQQRTVAAERHLVHAAMLCHQARPEYPDGLYEPLVCLANLRPAPGPRVDKLARNLR